MNGMQLPVMGSNFRAWIMCLRMFMPKRDSPVPLNSAERKIAFPAQFYIMNTMKLTINHPNIGREFNFKFEIRQY
jgi:hypothetical protein